MRICIGREQFIVYVTLSSKENYNYLYMHMGMVVLFLQLLREEGVWMCLQSKRQEWHIARSAPRLPQWLREVPTPIRAPSFGDVSRWLFSTLQHIHTLQHQANWMTRPLDKAIDLIVNCSLLLCRIKYKGSISKFSGPTTIMAYFWYIRLNLHALGISCYIFEQMHQRHVISIEQMH